MYNAGLYIRLSREDDDKLTISESIINQKSLLIQYATENNINIHDIYIDDGFSGTNFDRPGFNRLIKDIELKRVNMVITKDMSRLGRDYIGTGNLIEKYFPEHNVRYIAVTDNIDTYLDSSNNDIAPFKAIMNDMYAKDISKKIRSSLKAKMKEGKFVGGRTPFGYTQDPNDRNHLVVNEEQAIIVRKIFDMSLDGLSPYKIALKLTKDNVKTPASYYKFKWKNNYRINYSKWNSKTIKDILTNRMYTGDLVQNKRNKINYKVKKIVKNNVDNYIICLNTHEAIISKDKFNEVNKLIQKNIVKPSKKEKYLLDGLLYCADCNHRISIKSRRKKDNKCYTICNYYRTYMKDGLCTTHSNNYDKLEKVIIDSLKVYLIYIDKKYIKEKVINNLKEIDKHNKKIDLLLNEIKAINDNLDTIYIDKLNKKITDDQYERLNEKFKYDLKLKQKLINEFKMSVENQNDNAINNYIDNFLMIQQIDRELIVNLIDKINIYENKQVDIYLTFYK